MGGDYLGKQIVDHFRVPGKKCYTDPGRVRVIEERLAHPAPSLRRPLALAGLRPGGYPPAPPLRQPVELAREVGYGGRAHGYPSLALAVTSKPLPGSLCRPWLSRDLGSGSAVAPWVLGRVDSMPAVPSRRGAQAAISDSVHDHARHKILSCAPCLRVPGTSP